MSFLYRFEIYPEKYFLHDKVVHERNQIHWIKKYLDLNINQILEVKYFIIKSHKPIEKINSFAQEVLIDSVTEKLVTINSKDYAHEVLSLRKFKNPWLIDVGFKPGVTDNTAKATKEAFSLLPSLKESEFEISSGSLYYIDSEETLTSDKLRFLAFEVFANNLLQQVKISSTSEIYSQERFSEIRFPEVKISSNEMKLIDLTSSREHLLKLNQENCWAFSEAELDQILAHYKNLNRNPTDVEMEIIAQSWSEHCKHKIFASEIEYTEDLNLPSGIKKLGSFDVKGLFKTFIRGSTLKIQEMRKLPWLVSIFHDNAGVVRFDDKLDLCIKVETHNSPSALDPYGGALTGILGVNRDILGVGIGAKPIANTNVFCLAENEYFETNKISLPSLLKNPDRIKDGVHKGVQDGGNKSGIPTVNGAFLYDANFVGKPLVYCGTIGVIPHKENNYDTSDKRQMPGDFIVMAGGRIGKDGIHGATFSSMELLDNTPSSVVQIGDPITQKRLGDFLLEARAKNLFNSVTDNGAGGLSSSIGEMAQKTNGAVVNLEKALVKYPGLSPYELMVSESQERMTFSVEKEKIDEFLKLAKLRNVEASVVGEFTSSGMLQVFFSEEKVAEIDMHFLHESLAPMKLKAHFDSNHQVKPWHNQSILKKEIPNSIKEILLDVLSSSNVRSHEHLVRRYDHEVKAATIVKPFTGEKKSGHSSPNDGGVLWLAPHGGGTNNAVAVTCGINPKISKYDTYAMAEYAIDEAVRNAVCVGANPEEMVLVDNYCWPDPIYSEKNLDGAHKLAQLVRASKAIYDLSISYGMPFVSGKDSMKNDFLGVNRSNEKIKISVPPTLLITAMGRVPETKCICTSEVKSEQSSVYLLGADVENFTSAFELSSIYSNYQVTLPLPELNGAKQIELYKSLYLAMKDKLIESAHDISDGGLLVTLAEKIMATSFGLECHLNIDERNLMGAFFNEAPGRIVVTVKNKYVEQFEKTMHGQPMKCIGKTTNIPKLQIYNKNCEVLEVSNIETLKSYKILVGESL